jgi:hypothetical protein
MRKSTALLSGALFLVASVPPVFAQTKTVTGKLVDLACYKVNKENTGNAHVGKGFNCGQGCAREGFPVGLLTDDGKIYQVTGELAAHSNAKLAPHIGQTVIITGNVSEKGGITQLSASELK